MPWCNTEAMNLQLAAISDKVSPGRPDAAARSGWMASHAPAGRARRHQHRPAASQMPGAERAGKRLAVHAG
jgi:hypothetical protein